MALPPETPHHPRPNAKKADLSFEPLSDGLGFHPFSDGLPYAPISKAANTPQQHTLSAGTGAMAAGLPGYRPAPPPAAPRIQAPRVPTTTATKPLSAQAPAAQAQRAPLPVHTFSHPQLYKQARAATAPTAEAITASLSAELLQPRFGFGYLFKRVFAYLIDSIFNLSLCAGALSFALWKQDMSPELLVNPGIILVAGLFLGFFNWAITTAEEVAFGTSIGKRLFGLAIQGGASAIFLRAFFFLPSICFGGLGLVWAIFDRRRRCWHDLVVDIQPIEIARL